MRRRSFLGWLGGATVLWPTELWAQRPVMPTIGFLSSTSAAQWSQFIAAFHLGLGEQTYTEGTNVRIEYRWAEGQYDRLPGLASELAGKDCNVIVAIAPLRAQTGPYRDHESSYSSLSTAIGSSRAACLAGRMLARSMAAASNAAAPLSVATSNKGTPNTCA